MPIFPCVAHSNPLFLHIMMCTCGKNHIQAPGSLNFVVFILAGVLGLFLWMDMMKINLSLTTTSKISQPMPREVSNGTRKPMERLPLQLHQVFIAELLKCPLRVLRAAPLSDGNKATSYLLPASKFVHLRCLLPCRILHFTSMNSCRPRSNPRLG